jgi:Kef-type K+ transport system membrane component KefB
MKNIVLVVALLIMLFLRSPFMAPFSNPSQSSSLALGFILVFAFLVGSQTSRLSLPQITGFILAGILCGPFVLKFLSLDDVKDLQLLDGLALSLIALNAGGEMRLSQLKKKIKAVSSILLFQAAVIISGFIILGFLLRPFFSFFSEGTLVRAFSISLLLGVLATATSPSTTIAVITEAKAKGKYADLILSTAVVKDFLVIILFAFSLSLGKSLTLAGRTFDIGFIGRIMGEVGGSLLFGAAIGGGIILYLKYIQRETAIFILAVAFLTYQISHNLGYHPLLICLIAGFIVENFSSRGESLILAIERISLPVYVVFFSIAGASLDLDAVRRSWLLALIIVIWRGVLKFSGTYLGAAVAKEDRGIQRKSWAGFISQAGVSLGMVVVIEKTFPEWGANFKALVLAVIAINQVVGPVLLQRLLFKVDEAGKKVEKK